MCIEGIIWLRDVVDKLLPQVTSLDKLVEFFETHDMGDYWASLPEAHFEIDIRRKTQLFVLDDEPSRTSDRHC